MNVKDFVRSTFKIALAFVLAFVAIGAIILFAEWAKDKYDKKQAEPYEKVVTLEHDLKETIGMKFHVKTKLIDERLNVRVDAEGFPAFLKKPWNIDGEFTLHFLDSDGFIVYARVVKLEEFSTRVDDGGRTNGLHVQFSEGMDVGKYARMKSLKVGWKFDTTDEPKAAAKPEVLDHCAPDLSKAERLKRLAQHGKVRENGGGSYSAGERSLTFLSDATLFRCE